MGAKGKHNKFMPLSLAEAKSSKEEQRQARNLLLLPMKEVACTFEEQVKFGHFTKARCHLHSRQLTFQIVIYK
jgi:hypothetical protein